MLASALRRWAARRRLATGCDGVAVRLYEIHARHSVFRERVVKARALVATMPKDTIVCSSWGKDSGVLVSLALRAGIRNVAHLRSPYELPGWEPVRDWAVANGAIVHDVPTARTLDEYVSWLQAHGLHYERETLLTARKAAKRDELLDWVDAHGFTSQLLGMRADESKGRKACFRVRGLRYPAHGLDVCNPFGWWTTRDVWAYLVSEGVPWHRLYDCETHGETRETLRNGGWLSVHGSNDARIPWLREHFPEQYRALRERFPQVSGIG